MYLYKRLLESDESEAHEFFRENQEKFEKLQKAIMWFSLFGWIILTLILSDIYGEATGTLFFIGGFVGYILGYQYCEALWYKEKDASEFSKALEIYKKENQDRTT